MWSCCPSALSPEVGPSVESDAGEPASPRAPATAMRLAMASGENPSSKASGTKMAATMGMVPKDVPMPMVTTRPMSRMTKAEMSLELPMTATEASTRTGMPPVSSRTLANPAATSMTKAMKPMRAMPEFMILSSSFSLKEPNSIMTKSAASAPSGSPPPRSWMAKAATAPAMAPHCPRVRPF